MILQVLAQIEAEALRPDDGKKGAPEALQLRFALRA